MNLQQLHFLAVFTVILIKLKCSLVIAKQEPLNGYFSYRTVSERRRKAGDMNDDLNYMGLQNGTEAEKMS